MHVLFYVSSVLHENSEEFQIIFEGEAPLNQEIERRNTKSKEVGLNLPNEIRVNKNHPNEQVIDDIQKCVSIRYSLGLCKFGIYFSN